MAGMTACIKLFVVICEKKVVTLSLAPDFLAPRFEPEGDDLADAGGFLRNELCQKRELWPGKEPAY